MIPSCVGRTQFHRRGDAFGLGAPEVVDLQTGERSDVPVDPERSDTPIVWVYPEDDGSWTIFADGEMIRRRNGEIVNRFDVGMPINTGTRVGDLLGLVSNRGGEATVSVTGHGEVVALAAVDSAETFGTSSEARSAK